METKICSKCGRDLPVIRFYKHPCTKDGLHGKCKECFREYYETHKDQILEQQREHYKDHYETNKDDLFYQCRRRINTIKGRCENPNNGDYPKYGGRGIQLLFTAEELFDFVQNTLHLTDIRRLHIHRPDNDDHYSLDNIELLSNSEHIKRHRNKGVGPD